MPKIFLVIDLCHRCFMFNNEYYDYAETCMALDRKIDRIDYDDEFPIPGDCPLTGTQEETTDFILST